MPTNGYAPPPIFWSVQPRSADTRARAVSGALQQKAAGSTLVSRPPPIPTSAVIQCAGMAVSDEAGYNWNIVIAYGYDLAKAIEKRYLDVTGSDKKTRKNCVAFIRACGYGGAKLAHGSGKKGSGIHPKTKLALKDIAAKLG